MLPVGAVEQLELLVNVLLDDPAQQAPERCDLRRWFHGYKKKAPEVIAVYVGGGAREDAVVGHFHELVLRHDGCEIRWSSHGGRAGRAGRSEKENLADSPKWRTEHESSSVILQALKVRI